MANSSSSVMEYRVCASFSLWLKKRWAYYSVLSLRLIVSWTRQCKSRTVLNNLGKPILRLLRQSFWHYRMLVGVSHPNAMASFLFHFCMWTLWPRTQQLSLWAGQAFCSIFPINPGSIVQYQERTQFFHVCGRIYCKYCLDFFGLRLNSCSSKYVS